MAPVYKQRSDLCNIIWGQDRIMAIKLIVLAGLLAVTSAYLGGPSLYGYTSPLQFYPPLPALYVRYGSPTNDSSTDEIDQLNADPHVLAAYDTHVAFLKGHHLNPPYHYSFGYELYNSKTGISKSHYEKRYGEVALGNYICIASDGSRSIVDYAVDTPSGLHGVIRRDYRGYPVHFGYARFAGHLAHEAHPAPEEYVSRTTLLDDTSSLEAQSAYTRHKAVIEYFNLEAPFHISWGCEIKDAETGNTVSQYEAYYDLYGEGSFTQVGAGGNRSTINYSITPEGFAVTTPTTCGSQAQVHAEE